MPEYRVPIRDINFCLNHVLGFEAYYAGLSLEEEVNAELVEAILEEAARFCEQDLSPLNTVGDEAGCLLEDGVVYSPKGFREAYETVEPPTTRFATCGSRK